MASRAPKWGKRLLIVGAIVVVCAGAVEVALRLIIPGVVAEAIRSELPVQSDQQIDVSLGGSALIAALKGTVGDVTVNLPNMSLGTGITGDVSAQASSVPFRVNSGEITNASVTLQIPDDQLGAVASLVTNGAADSAEITSNELFVTHKLSLLGMAVPLSVSLKLEAVDGQITVTPTEVGAGSWSLTSEQISSATGSTLDGLLKAHTVCIADKLPRGVTLTNIEMSDSNGVKVTADLVPTLLSDPSQQTYGRCGG